VLVEGGGEVLGKAEEEGDHWCWLLWEDAEGDGEGIDLTDNAADAVFAGSSENFIGSYFGKAFSSNYSNKSFNDNLTLGATDPSSMILLTKAMFLRTYFLSSLIYISPTLVTRTANISKFSFTQMWLTISSFSLFRHRCPPHF
jgi:hypothetical protein